jgi:hypothetical protein
MFHFGGEIFVKYESGNVHYQDEFGRTEKPREFLIKKAPDKPLRPACADAAGKAVAGTPADVCGLPSGGTKEMIGRGTGGREPPPGQPALGEPVPRRA